MNLPSPNPLVLLANLVAGLVLAGLVLAGCGPSAEEQAGADRMQKGIESSRNAQGARPGTPPATAPR